MEERLTKAQLKEQRKQERQEWEIKLVKEQQQTKIKKIGFWVVGICIVLLSIWGMTTLVSSPSSSTTPDLTAPKVMSTDITLGPKTAKTVLIEYADFQCPACGFYHSFTTQAHQDFKNNVLFVYRFFPLTNIHQNALTSAKAGYAAYLQGKFWEMHDMLFEHQNDWSTITDPTTIFIDYAKKLGLDTHKFSDDMNADNTKKFIEDEQNAGINAGVNSTPSFFLNGKYITNPQTYEEFKQLIQDTIK